MRQVVLLATAVVSLAAVAGSASAQMPDNQSFDAQMAGQLGNMQAQNNAGMQQMWQQYLQQNGPQLHAQYDQLVAQGQNVGSFEQYAYFMMMSANGTNVQGMRDAQQQQYEGNVRANQTVQGGNSSYNAGMYANSEAQTQAVEGYDQQSIRGASPVGGGDGQSPAYAPSDDGSGQGQIGSDGRTYARDGQGNVVVQGPDGRWYYPAPQ